MSKRTVHVIDDDDAARDALTFLLGADDYSVRGFGSAQAFLDAIPSLQAGCVITDVRMPDIDGLELLRRLKSSEIKWPVIVITGHGDVPLAVEAIKSGAQDFIEKPYEGAVLLEAVRVALAVHSTDVRKETERGETDERLATLTARERQVMLGLVAGQPNKMIAYDLGISARTVEIYRANVMTKMQAKSLSHLVRMVLLAGV